MKDLHHQLLSVFSTAIDHETEAERKSYLDRVCAGNQGLRDRVEALLQAHRYDGIFLGTSPADPARSATLSMPRIAGLTSSRQEFAEELRHLLRSRLMIVHSLAIVLVVLQLILSLLVPSGDRSDAVLRPDYGNPLRLSFTFLEALLGTVILWRYPALSIRSLRCLEVALFFVQSAYNGFARFESLAGTGGGVDPNGSIGLAGLASLQGFVVLILAYGVLIPNHRRRGVLVVGLISAIPLGIIPLAAAFNPVLIEGHLAPLTAQWALTLLFPSAISVFAATRANALQQRAFDAERCAERMGQYTLKRKIGEGGMAEVWLAEHALMKRPCAIKFIRHEFAASRTTLARFAREVEAVASLHHFNTVRVYDYGQGEEGSFFFVMEYLDGPTLEAMVRENGPLSVKRCINLLIQVCGALSEAHAAGLVHRDLKPSNMIIVRSGGLNEVVKLVDFGLVHDLATETDQRLTQHGLILGTPAYMSPEQAEGRTVVDVRSDVYSLGAVAYFALTGHPPFSALSIGSLLAAHREQIPANLVDLRLGIPLEIGSLVARCLSKDPRDRYQTIGEVRAELEAWARE